MKFSIMGFDQKMLLDNDCDMNDAMIFRFLLDWNGSGRMKTVTHDGKVFFWVSYSEVIKQVPILKIKDRDALAKRFRKYVKNGLMEHHTVRKEGTFSYYRFTEKFVELQFGDTSPAQKPDPLRPESRTPSDFKAGQILPQCNSSIKNSIAPSPSGDDDVGNKKKKKYKHSDAEKEAYKKILDYFYKHEDSSRHFQVKEDFARETPFIYKLIDFVVQSITVTPTTKLITDKVMDLVTAYRDMIHDEDHFAFGWDYRPSLMATVKMLPRIREYWRQHAEDYEDAANG